MAAFREVLSNSINNYNHFVGEIFQMDEDSSPLVIELDIIRDQLALIDDFYMKVFEVINARSSTLRRYDYDYSY